MYQVKRLWKTSYKYS